MSTPDVGAVAEDLGPTLVVATSGDLGRAVTGLILTDPAFPTALAAGALVLAVGYRLGSADLLALCLAAREANVSGVMVKGGRALDVEGIAVVVVEPGADWAQLTALVRTATALRTPSDAESLFDIADAVAALCGGSVVMHDAAWELLAYSGGQPQEEVRSQTILGRRAPRDALEALRAIGVVERLMRGEVVHVHATDVDGLTERYAAGVCVGGQFFGTLWVLPSEVVPEEQALQGLRRAADIAALSFLRHANAGQAREAERDAALEALLSGGRTDRLVAERLRIAVDHGFVLAGLRPVAADAAERVAASRRLHALTRSYLEAYRVSAAVATSSDTLYVLFPSNHADARALAVKVVTDLHARLQRGVPHRAMISSAYPSLAETSATRTVVDELLDLAERRGWSGLTDSEAVQASWRLEQFREVALAHPALLAGPVMRLVEHDRAHGGDLVQTLRVWFESVGDTRTAAERLALHVNTIRYRLRKMEEITGLSLEDPDERLLAELQVRLLLG